jgi:hypothetical protein
VTRRHPGHAPDVGGLDDDQERTGRFLFGKGAVLAHRLARPLAAELDGGAIAHIRGYDLDDDRVRTLAVAALAGDATVKEAVRRIGTDLGTRAGKQAVSRISGRALIEINKKVGFRLLTKAGTTGVINISKAIPLVGVVVGGTVDGAATGVVGKVAKRTFPPRPDDGLGAYAAVAA